MGVLDIFRRKALNASPSVVEITQAGQFNQYRRLGGTNQRVQAAFVATQSASYAHMYAHQPAVRRVVDYVARNVAQLGLKLYERVGDTERERDTDHPAAVTMAHPNAIDPADRFIFNFVADYLVHDNAYALKLARNGGPRTLIQVPPPAVAVNGTGQFTVESYSIYRADGTSFDVDPADVMHWHGYNPQDARLGLSKLETLRMILAEDAASQAASIELSKSGLAKPGYIKRPLEAPEWSEAGRQRFQESWASQSKSSPRKTPVLEEGMEFLDFGVSPKDAEMLAGRQFTNDEVASLYGMEHCPPEDEEERKQFLADVLAPITQELCGLLDFALLEAEYQERDYYFEFDLNEKLRGDLETRFTAMTAAAGRPWATVNEIRARENLPPVDTGDELTIPLNVMLGDNPRPAPNVMPIQDPLEPPQDGSYREARALPEGKAQPLLPRSRAMAQRRAADAQALTDLLTSHFARQRQVTQSKAGAGAKAAVTDERWNRELGNDLLRRAHEVVGREGDIAAARMAGQFDRGEVEHYLEAMAAGTARDINATTAKHIEQDGANEAFDRAIGTRATVGGMSLATAMFALGNRFAAEQAQGDRMVMISGGECEICEPYQGATPMSQLDSWPPYHGHCECIAEVG